MGHRVVKVMNITYTKNFSSSIRDFHLSFRRTCLTDATFPAAEDEEAECKEDPLTLVVDNVVDLPSVIALDLISFSIFSLRAFSPSFNDTCPIVWTLALTGAAVHKRKKVDVGHVS